jgi:hypothetical protein
VFSYRPRIKRLVQSMIKGLAPFAGHSIHRPVDLLLQGLLSMTDMIVINDVPAEMRAWIDGNCEECEMRYVLAVMASKCWRLGGETEEWAAERELALELIKKLGLPEKITVGNELVDIF